MRDKLIIVFLSGVIAGLLAAGHLMAQGALGSKPQVLIYGRTTMGVNVPVQVDSMGVVQTSQ